MIDLHTHILPALDDGARSLDDAFRIATAAEADGVTVMAATPHVRDDFPTLPEDVERGVATLNEELAAAGIGVSVVSGAEVALDRLPLLSSEEVRRFTLGPSATYLLVEFPYRGWPFALVRTVQRLVDSGIVPILAHPERNGLVQDDPARVVALVDAGALVQLTAGSVDGSMGPAAARTAFELIAHDCAHLLASDVHGPHLRMGSLRAAVAELADDALARRLTYDVPAAILAGEPV